MAAIIANKNHSRLKKFIRRFIWGALINMLVLLIAKNTPAFDTYWLSTNCLQNPDWIYELFNQKQTYYPI